MHPVESIRRPCLAELIEDINSILKNTAQAAADANFLCVAALLYKPVACLGMCAFVSLHVCVPTQLSQPPQTILSDGGMEGMSTGRQRTAVHFLPLPTLSFYLVTPPSPSPPYLSKPCDDAFQAAAS